MTTEKWQDWSEAEIAAFQEKFLTWYHQEKRNLPWRANTNPYNIWISEIMLQQTRVDTVIGYFYRFMEEFPTIKDLAEADEQKLLKVWEGLGYYSRARNLKVAAQQIMEEFNGKFPETPAEISSLKGIGPYTTGAISSIAFGLPEPAIDGNIQRVTSRMFEIDADIAKASSRKVFDAAMRTILSHEQPGEMNQAFMDLGSSICTPLNPQCDRCPLQSFCSAYQTGRQAEFPVKTKKMKPKDVYYVAAAIQNSEEEYLLVQRPETGLLAKMWQFPLQEVTKKEYEELLTTWQKEESNQLSLDLVAEETSPAIFDTFPIIWQKRHFGEISHVFSHLRWHVLLFYGRKAGDIAVEHGAWVTENQFSSYVFPKPQQKLVEQLKKN